MTTHVKQTVVIDPALFGFPDLELWCADLIAQTCDRLADDLFFWEFLLKVDRAAVKNGHAPMFPRRAA